MRTRNGYFIELNGKNLFIIQESYYLKDKLIKILLLRFGCNYDPESIKKARSNAKRAKLGVDNLGNYIVKLKGGTFTHIENIVILNSNSFNLD